MKTTKLRRDHAYLCAKDSFDNTGSWKYGTGDTTKLIIDLIDDLSELEAKLEKCKETLRFYSGAANYWDMGATFFDVDKGDQARTVLAEIEGVGK